MPAKKRPSKAATSLDAKQEALLQEQERLRRKMQRLERMLEEAPRLQEQVRKQRREQFVSRPMRASDRVDAPILSDKRYNVSASMSQPRRRRAMRAEQRQARLTFFGLFCGLLLLLVWVYSVWRW